MDMIQSLSINIPGLLYFLCIVSVILLSLNHSINVFGHRVLSGVMGFFIMLVIAILAGYISFVGILWILLLILLSHLYRLNIAGIPVIFLMIALAFLLAIHSLPGYQNLLILDNIHVSPDSTAYRMYFNFDKFSAGFILFWMVLSQRERSIQNIKKTVIILPAISVVIGISIGLALFSGMIKFDPKITGLILIYAVNNLFFTVMAEESFFRGLIHKPLNRYFNNKAGLLVSGFLFGLSHYGAGRVDYVISAIVAGIGYAYVYHKTKSVMLSMASHWLLNLVHFIFFTYPFYRI